MVKRAPAGRHIRGGKTEIVIQTKIRAPAERCFDLARSIDFHVDSAASTQEQAVAGVTTGLIAEGEEVQWRAKHFGLWWNMRVRITGFRPPNYFQDSMVKGPFHSFTHDHTFQMEDSSTLMTDHITFRSGVPWAGFLLDRWVSRHHLQRFLQSRNAQFKIAAETNAWQRFLQDQGHRSPKFLEPNALQGHQSYKWPR